MTNAKKWGKKLFQLVALILVTWGIVESVRKVARELASQKSDITARSQELLSEAEQASNPEERQRLLDEAAKLTASAGRFWRAEPIGLLTAGLFYGLGMLPACLFWRRCLIALEQPDHLGDVVWAYFYGNLGKYFPGKAMVIVLRLGALERHGMKRVATSMTIFMETLTMMSVGGAVAAMCLIILNIDWRLTTLAVGLLLSTFVPTSPPVLRFLLPKLQPGVPDAKLREWTDRITWRLFLRGWLMLLVTWAAFGLSLMFALRSLPVAEYGATSSVTLLLSSVGACALAVVLGFVSLIPGGAGVRELVLSAVLAPVVGPIAAMCCALWVRVVWLATELSIVGLLAMIRLIRKDQTAEGFAAQVIAENHD